MRQARLSKGFAQDVLGVMIGLDEGCSSARISRYETGVHEPPFETVKLIAVALNVPTAYFYCTSDDVAELLKLIHLMSKDDIETTLLFVKERINQNYLSK
jgi:transcriptional regulator with XRE-family HTH domain